MELPEKGSVGDLARYRIETAKELIEQIEVYCFRRLKEV